jgi:hypothetical protein
MTCGELGWRLLQYNWEWIRSLPSIFKSLDSISEFCVFFTVRAWRENYYALLSITSLPVGRQVTFA